MSGLSAVQAGIVLLDIYDQQRLDRISISDYLCPLGRTIHLPRGDID
jgi:hypothetical protein